MFHANGVDLNTGDYEQRTALHVAASRGRPEVGFYLLNLPGIDVNVVDRSASAFQARWDVPTPMLKFQHAPAVQQGHHAAVCMQHSVCREGCLLLCQSTVSMQHCMLRLVMPLLGCKVGPPSSTTATWCCCDA